jgi:hypothetical protein
MLDMASIATVIIASDAMILFTLGTVWVALRMASPGHPALRMFGMALAVASLWGILWTFWPPLVAQRFAPPPFGQAGAILFVVVGFASLLLSRTVREYLRDARLEWLATMGIWRLVYGGLLLALGLSNALPSAFFWSAALGDIAVGMWSATMMARRLKATSAEFAAWNVVGLVDLVHVLALGAVNLAPFYLANLGLTPLNMLPLAGVPVFLALHILTLWGLAARRKAGRTLLPSV